MPSVAPVMRIMIVALVGCAFVVCFLRGAACMVAQGLVVFGVG